MDNELKPCQVTDALKKAEKLCKDLTWVEDDDADQIGQCAKAVKKALPLVAKLRTQAEGQCDGCGADLDDAFCVKCRRPEPPRREAEQAVKCEWVYEDPKWGYGRAMRVVESNHPRFVAGSRFDFGFMQIANEEGYEVTVAPMPTALTPAKGKEKKQ